LQVQKRVGPKDIRPLRYSAFKDLQVSKKTLVVEKLNIKEIEVFDSNERTYKVIKTLQVK